MQYDNYQRKVEKVADVIRFILKHMVKIVIAASVVMACITALLITKGIITDTGTCPESIVYGESFECNAKAFIADVYYEYAPYNTEDWSEFMPKLPGVYKIRAVSVGTFGYKRYGEPMKFEILKRGLSISPKSSFIYGNDPEANPIGLVSGDRIKECEFDFLDIDEDSATLVAKTSSIVIKDTDGKDVTSAYDITVVEATVAMKSRPIKIELADVSKVYDGTPLVSDEYKITDGNILSGDTIVVRGEGTITDVGEVINDAEISIIDSDGNDVTKFYYITKTASTLTVTKRPISVTTSTDSWEYADQTYFNDSFDYAEDDLVVGQILNVKDYTEIKNAGSAENILEIVISDSEGNDVSKNYEISYTYGTLTVNPRPITITTASDSWTYNDEAYSNAGFTISEQTPAIDGHVFSVVDITTITDVGAPVDNVLGFAVKNAAGDDISISNYAINYEYGTLTVNKRQITLTTASDEWIYDSTAHSNTGYSIINGSLATGHTLEAVDFAKITYVGNITNEIAYKVMKESADVSSNYDIVYDGYGTLTVTSATLFIESGSQSWEYDGSPHSFTGFTQQGLGANDEIIVVKSTEITNVGVMSNDFIEIMIKDQNGIDVTHNYIIDTQTKGTIEITPRQIKVKPTDVSVMYDANIHGGTDAELAQGSKNLVSGHRVVVSEVVGSGVNVGYYTLSLDGVEILILDGDNDVTRNYAISLEAGTLTVTKRTVSVQTKNGVWTYNDEDYYNEGFEVTSDIKPVVGHTLVVTSRTEIRNASEEQNILTLKVMDGDTDVSENYEISYTYGTLTVNRRAITIYTSSSSWVYDGIGHCDTGIEASGKVEGHEFIVTSCTWITEVGAERNNLTFIIKNAAGDNILVDNYNIVSYNAGYLQVTPRVVSVQTNSNEWTYDSYWHSDIGYSYTTQTELVDGHRLEAYDDSSYPRIKNEGSVRNIVTYKVMSGYVDVTSNYHIVCDSYGTLTVNKTALTVISDDMSWIYDGTAHFYKEFTQYGLCDNDEIIIEEFTKITNVGTALNVFGVRVTDKNTGEDVTRNYIINTDTKGTLEVTKREVTLAPKDIEVTYNANLQGGNGIKDKTAGITNKGIASGETFSGLVLGGGTDAGTHELRIDPDSVIIRNRNGDNVTENYDISFDVGTLTILKKKLTVYTEGAEKLYDGTPLTNPVYTSIGLVTDDHELYVEVVGSIIEVGEEDNIVNAHSTRVSNKRTTEDVTANYDIDYVYGKLLVKAMSFTVSTQTAIRMYDAQEHYLDAFVLSTTVFDVGGIYEGYTVSACEGTTVKDAGTYVYYVTVKVENPDGDDVTRFFDISYSRSTITVKKRPITLQTGSAEWVYNDEYQSCDDYALNTALQSPDQYIEIAYLTEIRDVPIFPVDNVMTVRILESENNSVTDVTRNYEVNFIYGTLNILPLPITVKTESFTHSYTGQPYNVGGSCFVSEQTPLAGDDYFANMSTNKSIVYPGSILNELTVIIYHINGDECTSNYDITYEYGTITVEQAAVVIKPMGEKVYDGTALKADRFVVSGNSPSPLANGHYAVAQSNEKLTNVGESSCTIKAGTLKILDSNGNDVTANYVLSTEAGTLTVTPRPITITTGSYQRPYDGSALTCDEYDISDDALLNGHVINIEIIGSIVEVGEVYNTIDYDTFKILSGRTNVTSNYEVNIVEGTLKVTPAAEIVVHTDSSMKAYDGTPLTAGGSRHYLTRGRLADGDYISVVVTGTITNPGSVLNTAEIKVFNAVGQDVTECYTITPKFGELTVFDINIDVDDDGDPDINIDNDYDGLPEINIDNDGDLEPDVNIDTNNDGFPELNIDTDGDGNPDINLDTDYDGIADTNIDLDGDGIADTNLKPAPAPNGAAGQLSSSGKIESADYGGATAESIICYLVRSDVDGQIYLKFKSFGNYNGSGFNEANPYQELIESKYSAFYLTALALSANGSQDINLEIISENGQYVLPYYVSADQNGALQKNDVIVSGSANSPYTVKYYVLDSALGLSLPEELRIFEQQYMDFVYDNYLDIDEYTLSYMRSIIREQQFDASSDTIVADVARYISNAAKYNLAYNRNLDKSDNVVVSFLRDYQQGICQHYAASAVMLYRALGIPARYTTGFVANAKSGEFAEVTAANAHAWVEIYLNGIGWIMIEVTGASDTPEISNPSWDVPEKEKEKIVITPTYQYKKYDGTTLYAENEITIDLTLEALLAKGYTYYVSVGGSQRNVGEGRSYIESFILYDPYNNDVTDEYDIIWNDGVLKVTDGVIVKIFLYEIQKYYDGKELKYLSDDYEVITDLPEGMTLELSINITMINVGKITNSEINTNIDQYISYRVYHNGVDVSENVIIIADVFEDMENPESYTPIRIEKRAIELTSASASKREDGEALTDTDVYITMGSLANGDTLYAVASGTITSVGTAQNTIESRNVRIVNANGEDVTDNYEIIYNPGILEVY